MSEKRFQDAKGNLAFTQALLDKHRVAQRPPQQETQPTQEMSQETPKQQPVEAPQTSQDAPEQAQPQQEESGIIKTIKDALAPIIKKVEDLLSKKEVTVKMDGTIEPRVDQ